MLGKLFGKKSNFFLELKEDEKTESTPAPAPVVEVVEVAAPPEAPVPVEQPAPTEAKAKKTSIKKGKEKKAAAPKKEVAPTVAPAVAPVNNKKVEPQEVEFATKYLIVPTMARRKPGPSLNPYKEMARKAKLPIK